MGRRQKSPELDIEIIEAVSAAKAAGCPNVQAACDQIARQWSVAARVVRGFSSDPDLCGEQLRLRHERVRREYGRWEPADPRARVIARIFGPRLTRRTNSAAKLLTGRPHKKKRQS